MAVWRGRPARERAERRYQFTYGVTSKITP